MTVSTTSLAASLFRGPGEMRALMRAHDWARTPVGPIGTWPESLKATVKTMLASQYAMVLTWGPEYTQFYNDAYSKFIGSKHPAALGIDIRVTLAESWDILGPMIEQVMRSGVANWTPALLLLLERSGYPEEAYFSVSHAPAEDDGGAIAGMLAVCSEVTQQVLAERRTRLLRDLGAQAGRAEIPGVEDVCRDVIAAIGQHPLDVPFAALYLREPDGRTLSLRGAVGVETGETALPPILDVAEPGDDAWGLRRAAGGETVLLENVDRHVRVGGGPWGHQVGLARAMPIGGAGGKATLGVLVAGLSPNRELDEGYVSFYELLAAQVSTAIRNARALEEERERADALTALDRAKTAFFSNVSHEFRTPLTLMLGPLEEVLAGGHLPAEQGERLAVARRNALRLLRLVNTLLDFSRIEAGRSRAAFQSVNLCALTADLASNFRSACEQAGLRLTVDCPDLGEPVQVDPDMWEKIVLNLLSNAFKFTFQGEIAVSVSRQGEWAVLEVRDTGVGIPPDELSRIFERFHRVESQQGRSHEGTGIGLALVRELVALHGGTIAAASMPGEGSSFTVRLPLGAHHLPESGDAGQELAPTTTRAEAFVAEAMRWIPDSDDGLAPLLGETAPDAGAPAADANAARPRILLADDNADMRGYVKRLLRESYDVETVADGQSALAAARAHRPDLVLLDVMMPGKDGFAVLRALRSEEGGEKLPIILLSARAGQEARVEGLDAGADDYLVKPFGARELLARVDGAIRLARQRDEAAQREAKAYAAAEAIERDLRLKEAMLSEINHRVKNNLQLISSLLTFTTKEVEDPLAIERLAVLKARVMNLGSIHNMLYRTDGSSVDAAAFLDALSREIHTAYGMDGVSLDLDLEPLVLDVGRMIPLGLLLNEALLNASKHAFDGQSEPNVAIVLRRNGDGRIRFAVVDNGSGYTTPRPGSSGMRLMTAFAGQLGGRLNVDGLNGTVVEVEFPEVRR